MFQNVPLGSIRQREYLVVKDPREGSGASDYPICGFRLYIQRPASRARRNAPLLLLCALRVFARISSANRAGESETTKIFLFSRKSRCAFLFRKAYRAGQWQVVWKSVIDLLAK